MRQILRLPVTFSSTSIPLLESKVPEVHKEKMTEEKEEFMRFLLRKKSFGTVGEGRH